MQVYIGYDHREDEAYKVACKSLAKHSSAIPIPLNAYALAEKGLFRRLVDTRGQPYDLASNAPCSTEFATSRFLTPLLCQRGWALFTDCDVVFLADPRELMKIADPDKAVMVVKHQHEGDESVKMDGCVQTKYNRKNWSSVMLFNCDHPANKRLSLKDVNERPGRDLHQFYWLADSEIGELPTEWNWLVDCQPRPDDLKIAHMTLGGPWIEGWKGGSFDDEWLEARNG